MGLKVNRQRDQAIMLSANSSFLRIYSLFMVERPTEETATLLAICSTKMYYLSFLFSGLVLRVFSQELQSMKISCINFTISYSRVSQYNYLRLAILNSKKKNC